MGLITRPNTAVAGNTIVASEWNADINTVYTEFNGNIDNANIKSGAAIAISKINTGLSGSLVGTSDTQTLTNKTLTAPTLTKPTINGSVQAFTTDSDGSTVTFDMAASNVHTVELGGNRTLAVSNVSVGQSFILRLVQDNGGSRTVTWFSTIKWDNGFTPILTETADKTDVFGFLCTSSGNYDGFILGQNL